MVNNVSFFLFIGLFRNGLQNMPKKCSSPLAFHMQKVVILIRDLLPCVCFNIVASVTTLLAGPVRVNSEPSREVKDCQRNVWQERNSSLLLDKPPR